MSIFDKFERYVTIEFYRLVKLVRARPSGLEQADQARAACSSVPARPGRLEVGNISMCGVFALGRASQASEDPRTCMENSELRRMLDLTAPARFERASSNTDFFFFLLLLL